jgi:hypothetical protein
MDEMMLQWKQEFLHANPKGATLLAFRRWVDEKYIADPEAIQNSARQILSSLAGQVWHAQPKWKPGQGDLFCVAGVLMPPDFAVADTLSAHKRIASKHATVGQYRELLYADLERVEADAQKRRDYCATFDREIVLGRAKGNMNAKLWDVRDDEIPDAKDFAA